MTEICDNGADEDCDGKDRSCFANDKAAAAVDVTAGGTFTGDSALATDDVNANDCGATGGRDVFFKVILDAPQVYYFDTFDSKYDTVIRVYRKACEAVGAGGAGAACADDACGGGQSQVAVSLTAGESCIVVDQRDGAAPGGELALRVMRGGRDGKPLAAGAQTTTGNTDLSGATSAIDPPPSCEGGEDGREDTYFFTACPGQALTLDAETCPDPGWDPVLHVLSISGSRPACDDDTCGSGPRITGATLNDGLLYFLFVDGFEPVDRGAYTLRTNIR